MEYDPQNEHDENLNHQPAQPQQGNETKTAPKTVIQYIPIPQEQPKKKSGWRIFVNILLTLSILGNVILFVAVIGLAMVVTLGSSGSFKNTYFENILIEGNKTNKIAVINLDGIIENKVSEDIRKQLDNVVNDIRVKAVILRINSPGGSVSSSDQIHYYISRLRHDTGKPVVAFMQSIAASGGYYSAVACDKIVAEPTVITGSIGVIMSHLVIKDLLEQKLGIQPEVIKSGPKKDWPSMFSEMTQEQRDYLNEKLIGPAYERFVKLVSEGRQASLSAEQVRLLADGSIYSADEALEKGLIDSIGYLEDAVSETEKLAGITNAEVVEYEKPLSWLSVLGAENKQSFIDKNIMEKIAAPQLMYLWDGKK